MGQGVGGSEKTRFSRNYTRFRPIDTLFLSKGNVNVTSRQALLAKASRLKIPHLSFLTTGTPSQGEISSYLGASTNRGTGDHFPVQQIGS
jgi:hypothetical protein